MHKISYHFQSFLKFLKSTDFSRGVLMAVAAISSLGAASWLGALNVGVLMAIGALVSSPSDINGSFRRRTIGILLSVFLAVASTIIAGYAAQTVSFVPILALLIFSLSMISVYGFRASLISFSGLFAVILSMASTFSGESVFVHALWMGLGGLWYLILSILLYLLNPGKQAEELLAEAFVLTAGYLRLRAGLFTATIGEREVLRKRLSALQADLNDNHEIIRELVLSRRVRSGRSGETRKKMLIFIELVDILEISMANPVNYERMETMFDGHEETLQVFKKWSEKMADELLVLSRLFDDERLPPSGIDLKLYAERANEKIVAYREKFGLPKAREAVLVHRSLYDFKEKQQEKIHSMDRILRNRDVKKKIPMKNKDAVRFITSEDYSLKNLQDNFDLNSPIFRHSLRLTVVLVTGYFIGNFFELQNTYWILLTTLVIMRPGYALTKERSKQRLYGTLIGGAIATSVILLTQNPIVLGVSAVITLIFAFSMLQRNYKAAAAFITLNIIFVYSLMRPDAFTVIEYRMLDTVIGSVLAFLGNSFLWPTFEYAGIKKVISLSIEANKGYLTEIGNYYEKKGKLPTSYKLARKQAFLAIGNLSAAFQRMSQEPESRQKNLEETYKVVTLNEEFLSSAASLGAFIATHNTTEASDYFRSYVAAILEDLSHASNYLEKGEGGENIDFEEIEEAERYFKNKYRELAYKRDREINSGKTEISSEMRTRFQEAQLVREQLKWLLQISENLKTQLSLYPQQ